jgi:hypothetical protein
VKDVYRLERKFSVDKGDCVSWYLCRVLRTRKRVRFIQGVSMAGVWIFLLVCWVILFGPSLKLMWYVCWFWWMAFFGA